MNYDLSRLQLHPGAESRAVKILGIRTDSPALLITGVSGIGKLALARRLAAWYVAGRVHAGDSDLEPIDPIWLDRILSGGEQNLLFVEPEGRGKEIPIESIRSVSEKLRLTNRGWRVVLFHPADSLNPSSSNALLKFLEEPPEQTLLILVSDRPSVLLPTLRSRCAILSMRPPAPEQATLALERLAPQAPASDRHAALLMTNHRPNHAAHLLEENGLDTLCRLFQLLVALPKLHPGLLMREVTQLSGTVGFSSAFSSFYAWLAWRITGLARQQTGTRPRLCGCPSAITEIEAQGFDKIAELSRYLTITRLVEIWQDNLKSQHMTQSVHLDRRYPVVALFHQLAGRSSKPAGLLP